MTAHLGLMISLCGVVITGTIASRVRSPEHDDDIDQSGWNMFRHCFRGTRCYQAPSVRFIAIHWACQQSETSWGTCSSVGYTCRKNSLVAAYAQSLIIKLMHV